MKRVFDRPFTDRVREANYLLRCKNPNCAGTVIDMDGEPRYLLCLKLHDGNGTLVEPRIFEQPTQSGRVLFKVRK